MGRSDTLPVILTIFGGLPSVVGSECDFDIALAGSIGRGIECEIANGDREIHAVAGDWSFQVRVAAEVGSVGRRLWSHRLNERLKRIWV